MHTIKITHECGCVRRSDFETNTTINDKNEALTQALEMTKTMNDDFCGKHGFQLVEESNNFVISFKEQSSSCCGGGCH